MNAYVAEMTTPTPPDTFDYEPWRHGGWYVHNVRYPSGAVGCVSRNFDDRKWRIVCDPRPFDTAPTFKNRDDAARAEWALAHSLQLVPSAEGYDPSVGGSGKCYCSIAHNGTGWDLSIVSPCHKHSRADALAAIGIAAERVTT